MNSELNHKINAIFNYGISPTTVNKIEILVLNEKLEFIKDAEKLLDRAYGFNREDMGWDVSFEDWKEKIKALTQQLNQLKQSS